MAAPAVECVGLSKSFSGFAALKSVSFDVRPGEVHALLGENGAGKSTLIRLMSGALVPDEGEVRVSGERVRFVRPGDARRHGIATVYQELLLFPDLTVAENIFLGNAPRTRFGALDWRAMRARARALLDSLESRELDVDARLGDLSCSTRWRAGSWTSTRAWATSRWRTVSGWRSPRRSPRIRASSSWTSPPPRSPRGTSSG
jgi:rhamnose transport system ATP-binding protein